MSRLHNETWWRMPPVAAPPPALPPRAGSPLRWAAPYWVAALGLAGLLQLDVIPVRGWLASPSDADREGPASDAQAVPAAADDTDDVATDDDASPSDAADDDSGADEEPPRDEAPLAFADGQDDSSTTFQSFGRPRRSSSQREPNPRSSRRRDPRNVAANPKTKRRRSNRAAAPKIRAATPATAAKARPNPKPSEAPRAAVSRSSGTSCSAAIAAYREEVQMGKSGMPADLTAARYGAVLNRGTYFSHCGVPDAMRVHICAAVQNGVALGVTVTTEPGSAKVASCIASAVRGLSFPSHPRMDVTRTSFE